MFDYGFNVETPGDHPVWHMRRPTCGRGGSGGATTPGTGTAGSNRNGLHTQSTPIGAVLADASGHTVYELVGGTPAHPGCVGSCLSVWPKVAVNGTQVVVNGHPVYRFASDAAAGQTGGQGLKDQWGTWWALDPDGNPITTKPPASGSNSSSGGYHY